MLKRAFLLVLPWLLGTIAFVRATLSDDFLACMTLRRVADNIILPNSSGYSAAIADSWVSNVGAMPVAFYEPTTLTGVKGALKCAQQIGVGMCPRNGGHSKMGAGLCNGVVLDMFRINGTKVNTAGTIVTVYGGTVQGQLVYELATFFNTTIPKFIPTGECPQVGISGFMLGGGLTEFDGQYGIGCDNVRSYKIVLQNGTTRTVTKTAYPELYWGLCGGGGGQFGITMQMTFSLFDRRPYDNNAYFRYDWPIEVAPDIIQMYSSWDLSGGTISMKLKSDFQVIPPVIRVFGVCWFVNSSQECDDRLMSIPLFGINGSIHRFTQKGANVLEVLQFLGKTGNYGQKVVPKRISIYDSFANQLFGAASNSNSARWASVVLKYPTIPDRTFFLAIVNLCANRNVVVCNWRRLGTSVPKFGTYSSFPWRDSTNIFYIAVKNTPAVLSSLFSTFYSIQTQYTTGAYVNYASAFTPRIPMFWGSSYDRLVALKLQLDPSYFFINPLALVPTSTATPSPPPTLSPSPMTPALV